MSQPPRWISPSKPKCYVWNVWCNKRSTDFQIGGFRRENSEQWVFEPVQHNTRGIYCEFLWWKLDFIMYTRLQLKNSRFTSVSEIFQLLVFEIEDDCCTEVLLRPVLSDCCTEGFIPLIQKYIVLKIALYSFCFRIMCYLRTSLPPDCSRHRPFFVGSRAAHSYDRRPSRTWREAMGRAHLLPIELAEVVHGAMAKRRRGTSVRVHSCDLRCSFFIPDTWVDIWLHY